MPKAKILAVLVSPLVLVAVCVMAYRWQCLRIPQEAFDATAWELRRDLHNYPTSPTIRQRMIKDLVTNVLPGKTKHEIESLLGVSPTKLDMKSSTFIQGERDLSGKWKTFPRYIEGYYYQELEWDLIYPIGKERIFLYDHRGLASSPDTEQLVIRLDHEDKFESWCISGSARWPSIVGNPGIRSYSGIR